MQEESGGGGGVGLRPGLFDHTVAHRNLDVLLGGGDRWVRRGWIWFFGWSFHVNFGTHDSVLLLQFRTAAAKREVSLHIHQMKVLLLTRLEINIVLFTCQT